MAVYDRYATRRRVKGGVAIRKRQNRLIFELGLAHNTHGAQRILEIGPGDGYVASMSASAGHRYVAVEGSVAVAERLRQRGFGVHAGYVPPLPSAVNGPFTCCFALHVVEHLPNPQAASQLMHEVHARLAPGGTFVIACPDYLRWGSRFFDCDYTHSYPMSRRRLDQLLVDHGFEVVHHTIYTGPIFGYAGLPLSWLAKLLYPRLLDDLIGRAVRGDLLNRGLLAFLPNLLTVARPRG